MTQITVTRWKRYGHDRAYAAGPDDVRVGWMDLTTGLVTIEEGADSVRVTAELQAWNAQRLLGEGAPVPALAAPVAPPRVADPPPVAELDEPTPGTTGTTGTDLAARVPGELAREHARLEWERQKRIGVVPALLGKLVDAKSDERAWRVGAEGEERVGKVLDRLTKRGWRILHSIPVGDHSDIDHLAIGPGGVVLINTKHHPKAKVSVTKYGIRVNGSKTEHFKQVRAQKNKAQSMLTAALGGPVEVHACLAIYNGGLSQPDMKIASTPTDIWVATNWNIGSVLKRLDPELTETQVEAIYDVARRSTTWQ
jgi:hypothetical protein